MDILDSTKKWLKINYGMQKMCLPSLSTPLETIQGILVFMLYNNCENKFILNTKIHFLFIIYCSTLVFFHSLTSRMSISKLILISLYKSLYNKCVIYLYTALLSTTSLHYWYTYHAVFIVNDINILIILSNT